MGPFRFANFRFTRSQVRSRHGDAVIVARLAHNSLSHCHGVIGSTFSGVW
jgi:hypothetical protein